MPTFSLSPKQQEAVRLLGSPARHIMLRGGSRSGKTFLLIRAICIRAMKAANSRHAVFRFRFNHARTSIWNDTLPKVMELCFPDVPLDTNETDLIATFPNGSQIILGGLDDKVRVEKILGQEYATLYFNECSQIPWGSVETALSRLAQKTELALKVYYDCNPPSKAHWTYQVFKAKVKPGTKESLHNPDAYVEMQINPRDNVDNLAPEYLEMLAGMSSARRLRFEAGEWATDTPGALWALPMIDSARLANTGPAVTTILMGESVPGASRSPIDIAQLKRWAQSTLEQVGEDLTRIVVAVDPNVSNDEGSDEIGIVVAGKGVSGQGYVLADLSMKGSPNEWASTAILAHDIFKADRIIGEANQGGNMVEHTIKMAATDLKNKGYRSNDFVGVTLVHATRGKVTRAEPVAAIYEHGRVSHVGQFLTLEDQMCSFTSDFDRKTMGYSPDRVDALVWALTHLFLEGNNTGLIEFYKQEYDKKQKANVVESTDMVTMRAPGGISMAYGITGKGYTVQDGLISVEPDDVSGLRRAGFVEVTPEMVG